MASLSAIVVTFNEQALLEDCLKSLHFCDEIIAVDLGSSDLSLEILKQYTTKIYSFPRTPVVEEVKQFALQFCQNDWILFIDPDERIDSVLAGDIKRVISSNQEKLGIIVVPWLFYYKGRALKGTFWGQHNLSKQIIMNRRRAEINLYVHGGYRVLNDFEIFEIQRNGKNVLHHYWMSSMKQLFAKHKMYIKKEGAAKYEQKIKYSFKRQMKGILTEFYDSFIIYKGYKDGGTGLFLSLFRSWYVFQSFTSLKKYERKMKSVN